MKEINLLKKIKRIPTPNRENHYINIKNNKIPVTVDKLIEKGDQTSDRIFQKQFYIDTDKTIQDLEKMVENRINLTKKEKIHIQLFVYDK